MNKKLVAALSGGAALVLALTGCSDDEGNKLDDWAKKFCDPAQAQFKKIQDANAAMQTADDGNTPSKKIQETDSKAFQQVSDAYAALSASLGKAGAPPAEGGEESQKNAVKELNSLSKGYTDLKKQVEGLDTGDKLKFAGGLRSLSDGINKLNKQSEEAFKKLEAKDVGKAMARQPGCQTQNAKGSGQPSVQPKK
ncbi:small secreted protein [Streptomyces sp. MST-110588]|uniref:small secreted protein n=1 Tax=Streptomyces sp. MST-110588 TaxID=2833628 RepID=UPI001F5DD948|nr:small secreted protein [Streptomyces sp. MST-110588]UNO40677.1 small secreted protein [Streptomyces sp. MST-110588]